MSVLMLFFLLYKCYSWHVNGLMGCSVGSFPVGSDLWRDLLLLPVPWTSLYFADMMLCMLKTTGINQECKELQQLTYR